MKTVPLGSQGLLTSQIGLGCMGMSTAYRPLPGEAGTNDAQLKEVFDACEEQGISMLNSAEFYGADRHNETLIGKLTAGRTEKFQVSLKVGFDGDLEGGMRPDSSSERIKSTVDRALQLLGRDQIDVIILARIFPDTQLEQVMQCFKGLVEAGKVKYVGLSEASPSQIRAAHAVHPLSCIEQEWSLWSRDIEEGIVPVCKELGVGILAYSPLGRGFLTGSITKETMSQLDGKDFRVVGQPRLQGDNLDANLKLVEVVKDMAGKKGCTAGQLAIAWLYQQAHDMGVSMVAIPGTKKVKYLRENIAALDVQLSAEDMQHLNASFGVETIAGDRYAHKALMFAKD